MHDAEVDYFSSSQLKIWDTSTTCSDCWSEFIKHDILNVTWINEIKDKKDFKNIYQILWCRSQFVPNTFLFPLSYYIICVNIFPFNEKIVACNLFPVVFRDVLCYFISFLKTMMMNSLLIVSHVRIFWLFSLIHV